MCLLSVLQPTNLVRMLADSSSDFTLRVVMILLLTSCCMKRCRSSTCFAFFDVPSLVAIDFAALLSLCVLMLMRTSNTSLMKLRSCTAVPIAYSSDSLKVLLLLVFCCHSVLQLQRSITRTLLRSSLSCMMPSWHLCMCRC